MSNTNARDERRFTPDYLILMIPLLEKFEARGFARKLIKRKRRESLRKRTSAEKEAERTQAPTPWFSVGGLVVITEQMYMIETLTTFMVMQMQIELQGLLLRIMKNERLHPLVIVTIETAEIIEMKEELQCQITPLITHLLESFTSETSEPERLHRDPPKADMDTGLPELT